MNGFYRNEAYDRLREAQIGFRPLDTDGSQIAPAVAIAPVNTGELLRKARETLGLTQAALAEKLGIQAPALSAMENGAPIKPVTDFAMRYLLSQ